MTLTHFDARLVINSWPALMLFDDLDRERWEHDPAAARWTPQTGWRSPT